MVDLTGLPWPPSTWPDPKSCNDFPEWLRGLTEHGGVTQRQIAQVAGATPQAVTKWLKGGSIEIERLARLAEWSGTPLSQLRNLLDEAKIGILPTGVRAPHAPYLVPKAADTGTHELAAIWAKLTPDNRQQLLGMATLLVTNQGRKPSK